MICFKVAVNGKKICTAGVPEGVLTLHVDWVGLRPKPASEIGGMHLAVVGLTEGPGCSEHVRWGDFTELSVGDVVTVKIVSADHADKPTERKPGKKHKRGKKG